METIKSTCFCLDHFNLDQKQKADAIASEDFLKFLIELQAIRFSLNSEKTKSNNSVLGEYKRADDIMKVFFSEELQIRQPGSNPYFLEKKFPFLGPSVIEISI